VSLPSTRAAASFAVLAALLASAGRAAPARAQEEELIDDPELAPLLPPEPGPEPEPGAPQQGGTLSSLPPVHAPNGEARVVLRSRVGVDADWSGGPTEEVVEATQIALFELRVRRSERLRFAAGVRVRHLFATRQDDTLGADAERFELDVTPTAGYGDVGVADGVHLRLGYQTTRLGRFDVLNASDVLSVYDLRSGPTTMPEASAVAQPAARLDWDISQALALRVFYLPFVQPHLVRAFDGDYALLPGADVAELLAGADPQTAEYVSGLLRGTFTRAGQGRLAESGFDAFAPDPSFTEPQGAARLTWRGTGMELSATAAVAHERLPVLHFSQAFLALAAEDTQENRDALEADTSPIEVQYRRFGVLSVDGAFEAGPVMLGAELAYMRGRTLFASAPGELALPERVDLAHLGLRAEYLAGERWVLATEGFLQAALWEPDDPGREYVFMAEGRLLFGGVAFLAWSPADSGLTLELGGGALNGPTYMIVPRAELQLGEALFAELGAYVLGGRRVTTPGDPGVTLGGLYEGVDQVFLGVRWLP
jgi:hypothetical protein